MISREAMSFAKQYNKSSTMALTDNERKTASVLIVESAVSIRASLRQTITSLGYGAVSDAPDHNAALQKLEQRGVTHVIFEARSTNMPAKDFLAKVLQIDDKIIAIPSSFEPSVDDVFNLLIAGARGYVVKPFSPDALDDALVMASKGEPISDAILHAKDRNEALVSFIMSSLDRVATVLRQAQQFETAQHELPKRVSGFKRSVDIAHHFAKGGPDALLETMVDFCIDRSNGPATRLGRLRKRLNETVLTKKPEATDGEGNDTSSPPENSEAKKQT